MILIKGYQLLMNYGIIKNKHYMLLENTSTDEEFFTQQLDTMDWYDLP